MSSELTKENISEYLSALGKAYRKYNGKRQPVDIFFVGGANILINYNFRHMSSDLDGYFRGAGGSFNDAVRKVANDNNLDIKWLNDDFKNTSTFSTKIPKYSDRYREFGNCVTCYTLKPEALITMKLMSAREYKTDLSDAIGVIKEERDKGNNIDLDNLSSIRDDLYGKDSQWPNISNKLINTLKQKQNIDKLFTDISQSEVQNREAVKQLKTERDVITRLEKTSNISTLLENNQNMIWVKPHIRNGKYVQGHFRRRRNKK